MVGQLSVRDPGAGMANSSPSECREVSGVRCGGPAVDPPWPAGPPLLPSRLQERAAEGKPSFRKDEVVVLRFVFARPRGEIRRRVGIVRDLRLGCVDAEEIEAIRGWLTRNLPIPPRESFSADRALCWFKLEARACIEQMRSLAFLLERRGERVWQIYSRNPGLITYEDDSQIVAIPHSRIFAG